MCGILGRIGQAGPVNIGALRHRGPDGERTVTVQCAGRPVVLGHARLAINDLSDAGLQPMKSACSPVHMVFNGEIYNYPQLRARCEAAGHTLTSSMDGEVILHLYEDLGLEALGLLDGIFAVCLVDERSGQVHLGRDRMGVKPLFFGQDRDVLVFASEPAAVARELRLDDEVSVAAAAALVTFLWLPDPHTPWERVRSLPPGHVLTWSADGAVTSGPGPAMLELPTELRQQRPVRLAAELRDALGASVQSQLLADVPIGLMASGGVDSTLIWDAAGDAIDRAYVIGGPAGEEGLDEDAAAATAWAARVGTPLTHLPIPDDIGAPAVSGDLLADPAMRLVESIAERARQDGIPVLLSGQGADELLGGYRRHGAALVLQRTASVRRRGLVSMASAQRLFDDRSVSGEYGRRLAQALSERDDFAAYMRLCTYAGAEARARLLGTTTDEVSDERVWATHRAAWDRMPSAWPLAKKAMTLDMSVYLPGLGLAYSDRASMTKGVEVRVPWLGAEVVDLLLAVAPQSLTGLWVRKKPAIELARRTLMPAVWDRPKRGFGVPREQLGGNSNRQSQYISFATDLLDAWGVQRHSEHRDAVGGL